MIAEVDQFIEIHEEWRHEIKALRNILLECKLTETFKWRTPCYAYQGKNLFLIGTFKDHCVLSFLKGVLLHDSQQILEKPGENSNSGRVIRFKGVAEIEKIAPTLKAYIFEAIEAEKAGIEIDTSYREKITFAEELLEKLEENPELKKAFETLSPGRQRGYNIYFAGAKQSKTRTARVEKYIPWILKGFGMNDCICGLSKKKPNCDGSHKSIKGFEKEIRA